MEVFHSPLYPLYKLSKYLHGVLTFLLTFHACRLCYNLAFIHAQSSAMCRWGQHHA